VLQKDYFRNLRYSYACTDKQVFFGQVGSVTCGKHNICTKIETTRFHFVEKSNAQIMVVGWDQKGWDTHAAGRITFLYEVSESPARSEIAHTPMT
jgi:hypothetical protein